MSDWETCDSPIKNKDEYKDNIVKDVENVFASSANKEIVLCVGKVQSGKTNKIFKCIEYAFLNCGYDVAIIFGGTTDSLYLQTLQRLNKYLNEKKNLEVFLLDKHSAKTTEFTKNRKFILNVIKPQGISDALSFLKSMKDLQNRKVLIIDDECDYASVNVSKGEQSPTFKNIVSIYESFWYGKLLQVTATPFANIVSKYSRKLIANRVVCWSNSDEYTGLLEFNSRKKYLYEILDADKENPKAVSRAINKTIMYYLAEIINNFEYFSKLEVVNCLFNIDSDTDAHTDIYKKVKLSIENIIETGQKLFYNKYINKDISFDEFRKRMLYIFDVDEYNKPKRYGIVILNSKEEDKKTKQFNFIIGGTLISRGNTFENLLTELIINSPKSSSMSVDTLLQRCRWFGYRRSLMPHMKIFMNENIYHALLESEDYVKMLTTGQHTVQDLCRDITNLDLKKKYVKSTGKD